MSRPWFFILLSLAAQDRHGSGIMRDVLDLTGGELRLWPATLYGALEELREREWIRSLDAAPAFARNESARKRWYRITAQGRRALAAETASLEATLKTAQRRLAHRAEPV
ncbi:MAG TPA: helix-turn-helix transcriptional regulator [Gemmatimonadaceae bacterium]|nr:helix-turn-helix transcriptional regulator [Gemmatimonadaceae bacterium]